LTFFNLFSFRRETISELKAVFVAEEVNELEILAFLARFRGGIDDS